ncbi:MAG: DALR anticodon-binding domain-containing protein, partial [Novosphingobium sp.]
KVRCSLIGVVALASEPVLAARSGSDLADKLLHEALRHRDRDLAASSVKEAMHDAVSPAGIRRLVAKASWASAELVAFIADRLKVQQRETGVRHDLIDAVFALGGEDDLVRLLNRVGALQQFVAGEDGANLLVAYKRAANILRKENYVPGTTLPENAGSEGEGIIPPTGEEDPLVLVDDPILRDIAAEFTHPHAPAPAALSYPPEPAEAELIAALDAAEPRARTAVEKEDFGNAMAALASLRAPIDAFFDHVTVNDADPAKRAARLALLARFRDAVHQVADFSKIEG